MHPAVVLPRGLEAPGSLFVPVKMVLTVLSALGGNRVVLGPYVVEHHGPTYLPGQLCTHLVTGPTTASGKQVKDTDE